MDNEKKSIWHKSLNLVFVYVVIFILGLVMVFAMTSILNNKVKELDNNIYAITNN